jgi:hypothetical protein
MRILVFILIFVFQLTAAAIGLFVLLLGLNGYSERQSTPSIILYITLSLTSSFALGAVSPFAAKRLAKGISLGSFGASAIVVVAFSIIGGLVLLAGLFASVALAELLSANR